MALGRAAAAHKAIFDEWQARIDALTYDRSLTPDQRAAAIVAFRARQQIEANGARKRIMDEVKQAAKVARHQMQTPRIA